jgi:hypothetical protein
MLIGSRTEGCTRCGASSRDDVLADAPIFRLSEALNRVYVSEDIVAAVESAGLVG